MATDLAELTRLIDEQKKFLLRHSKPEDVTFAATDDYKLLRARIVSMLKVERLDDPLPIPDLWQWITSDCQLLSYNARKDHLDQKAQSGLAALEAQRLSYGIPVVPVASVAPPDQPTSPKSEIPESLQGAFMIYVWPHKWLIIPCVILFMLFAIWETLPDDRKNQIIATILGEKNSSTAAPSALPPKQPDLPAQASPDDRTKDSKGQVSAPR